MPGRTYHWKHGWIPLDDYARRKKNGGDLPSNAPVSHADLPRASHVVATHDASSGSFELKDKQSGHTAKLSMSEADAHHSSGAQVTGIGAGGKLTKSGALRKGEEVRYTQPGRTTPQTATVVGENPSLGVELDLGFKRVYAKPDQFSRSDESLTPELKKVESARIKLAAANDALSRAGNRRSGRTASTAEVKLRARVSAAQSALTAAQAALDQRKKRKGLPSRDSSNITGMGFGL